MIKGVGIDLIEIKRIKKAIDNKKALPQSGKNLVIRASLVEGASEARPHNQRRSAHYISGNQRLRRLLIW